MSRRVVQILISLVFFSLVAAEAAAAHPCSRACGAKPMTCRYDFVLGMYASMSTECAGCPFNLTDCYNKGCVPAEGRKKMLYLVNQQLPGPSIEVCKGDRIIVDLSNDLMTETTTIHWHGFKQRQTPFMDGVPYLTQCPVPPSGKFRYDFIAEAAGTFLWHSHSNEQRGEGMFGSLIVRDSSSKSHHLYDKDEHVVVLTDWTRESGLEVYSLNLYSGVDILPHTILINGLGRYRPIVDEANNKSAQMPIAVFEVEKGLRYRFRLINAGVQDCPLEVQIDGHRMIVINSDAYDVEPVEVDSVRILSGERYDVIVSADREIGNFWFRVRGREGSECTCDRTKAYQVAILRYKGAPEAEPSAEVSWHLPPVDETRQVNAYDKGQETPDALSVVALNFTGADDLLSRTNPDHKFYLSYDYVNLDERMQIVKDVGTPNLHSFKTLWQINHINMKVPNFPPLTQPELVKPGMFCNSETVGDCLNSYCHCPHVLSVKLNSIVELVLVDEGQKKFNHPLHLHGTAFRVVAMEKLGNRTTLEEVKKLDAEGRIKRKLSKAPFKDTIMVPSGGYTVVRFHADNPGYWIFHCHFEMHADLGMALVFKVGEHEDFVKPPANFPKCGLYKPNF